MQLTPWKKHILEWVANSAFFTGVTSPRRDSSLALIVTFHRVLPAEQKALYPYPDLAVTPSELAWCVEYFKQHYTVVPVSQLFSDEKRAQKPLAITFDDGQADNFVNAAPVLEKAGVNATFYIPTQALDQQQLLWHDVLGFAVQKSQQLPAVKASLIQSAQDFGLHIDGSDASAIAQACKKLQPQQRSQLIQRITQLPGLDFPEWAGMMSWQQVKQLADKGHEIGSHSVTHAILPALSDTELEAEIHLSKKIIEEKIGMSIKSFCYPNGDYDARCERAVKSAGYENAVSTRWGGIQSMEQRFAFPRCDITMRPLQNSQGDASYPMLAFRLSGMHPATWRLR